MTVEELRELLESRRYKELRAAFADMNVVRIAEFCEDLPPNRALVAFRTLPKEIEADVFAELSGDAQGRLIEALSDADILEIIDDLMVDDVVDLLEEIPANLVTRIKRLIPKLPAEQVELINRFLLYSENSAGSIMTAEFTDLKKGMSVADAIKRIRRVGEDRETIYTCYVTDETRHLIGVITVRDLLLADDDASVDDLMDYDVVSVGTAQDREEAVQLIARYGFMALPVVDAENRLVGIVTVDDAVDVIQEENTEDFEKMAAMTPSEAEYLKTSVFRLARNRLTWLLVLMVSGMITGYILGYYEELFAVLPLLVTFIPMLADTGGNAGSQSSTMVIRGMVLGEVYTGDWAKVLLKEIVVSVIVAVPLAAVNYLRIILMYSQDNRFAIGIVVSLAMVCTVVIANTIGGLLPIAAKRFRIDPAIMAAPLITTIVDALSLIIYFNIAEGMLRL
ncbi:MAG: magnesium transporter [Clostridiales bacterium]|jgi:magnesium transporter|nr:magnesium transporter [Clostridiales bacterium]